MRILIATQHCSLIGGVETYAAALIPALISDGHEIALLTEYAGAEGVASIASACPTLQTWAVSGQGVEQTLSDIDRWKPDVIYAQGLSDPILEARVAKRFPTVYFAHGYQGTCISGTKCHSARNHRICERRLGPVCLAAYLPFGCGGRNPVTMIRMYRAQMRRRATLDHYRAVLVASRHMLEEYRRHGVRDDRLHLAPLFPTDSTTIPDPPAPRSQSGVILFVGRLTPMKGLDHLLEALPLASEALGRNLQLVVAGDGPERERQEAQVAHRGSPVRFLGWIDAARRREEMRLADLLVVPSLWPEPFGLVGVEAACLGLPSVGYVRGGIADWLIPGETGEGVVGGTTNPTALAAEIANALKDYGHWNHLRQGAWKAASRFTLVRHLTTLTSVFERCA